MVEGGYAAVTSRRVASTAGVKPQLVHYYFRTMDDLFLALFRRGAELNLARQAEAMASPRPLHALWRFSCDPAGTSLTFEFTALANHRKAIRAEIGEFAKQFRRRQESAVAEALAAAGVEVDVVAPLVAVVVGTAISRVLSMERALGLEDGHAEAIGWVEQWLDRLEPAPEAG